jgi:hypothetical protein
MEILLARGGPGVGYRGDGVVKRNRKIAVSGNFYLKPEHKFPQKRSTRHLGGPKSEKEAGTEGCLAVVTDGLDRAFLHGILASLLLFLVLGLLGDVGVTLVLVALEVVGSGLAAQVTVDAVGIHVPGTVDVVFHFIGIISHGIPPGDVPAKPWLGYWLPMGL